MDVTTSNSSSTSTAVQNPAVPAPSSNYAIAALAVASGVDCVTAALGLAAVLGGIAGPEAGVVGVAGDLIHPGMNLVVCGRDNAAWRRLEELLFGPVDACQRRLRAISRAVDPERLDRLENPRFNNRVSEIVDHGKQSVYPEDGLPLPYLHEQFHLSALRTPTFFLRQPEQATWEKALPELMGTTALIRSDGSLLTQLLTKPSAKGSSPIATHLAAAATGQECFIERGKQAGPGRIDTLRAHLLITAGRDEIRDALAADQPVLQRLLQSCLLVDPPCGEPDLPLNSDAVRLGYETYVRAVKTVLHARRNGTGYRITPTPEILVSIDTLTKKMRTWCDGLPARLQPFFTDSLSLPYRLCWAFSATRTEGESSQWMLPFLWHVLKFKLWRQKKFLEDQMLAAEAAESERARRVMLQKLVDLVPCPFRDLLRRYPSQRRALHQPVLDALIQDGKVLRDEDGRLQLTDAGRKAA